MLGNIYDSYAIIILRFLDCQGKQNISYYKGIQKNKEIKNTSCWGQILFSSPVIIPFRMVGKKDGKFETNLSYI